MNSNNNNKAQRRRNITIKVTVIAAFFSGIFFILMLLRVSHMHIVFPLTLGLSALLITYLVLWTLCACDKHARLAKNLKRCYIVFLSIGLICFLIVQGVLISNSFTENADVDAIIVLGAGLRNNVPSLILASRLNAAIEYSKTQGDVPIIVTGGLGSGEILTEAEAMSRYLIERGVDEYRILKEDASTNTRENLAFSKVILEELGMDTDNIKVAIVSNEFHLLRAKIIAEKAGLDAIGVAAETPGLHRKVLYYFREAFALTAEVLLRR